MPIVEKNNFVFAFCRKNRVTSVNCGFKTLVLHPGTSLRNMTVWRVAVTLLVVASLTLAFLTPQCPQGPGCNSCIKLPGSVVEVICGTEKNIRDGPFFQVKYRPHASNEFWLLEITCVNAPNWSDFHLGIDLKLKYMSCITFVYCDFPENRSLTSIVNQLIDSNTTNVEAISLYDLLDDSEAAGNDKMVLRFNSDKNLTLKLTRAALKGFDGYTEVDISHNKLRTVQADLFRDFHSLETLDLSFNDLREIPANFLSLSSLRTLVLERNSFLVIATTTFADVPGLKVLDLSENQIKKIDNHSFDTLKKLRTLNLRENNLKSLPPNIFLNLTDLTDLNLSSNNFSNYSLSTLNFENNKELEKLELSQNKRNLMTLPKNFPSEIFYLKKLKLINSGITHLPCDLLKRSVKMDSLILSHNHLVTLPDHVFSKNYFVNTVRFSDNYQTDTTFSPEVKYIDTLDMSNNRIEIIEKDAFENVIIIEAMNFSNNRLTFSDFSSKELDLNENNMSLFKAITVTEELNFDNNNISSIFGNWRRLSSLKVLRLRNNQITHISHLDLCFYSRKTVELDLRDNKITRINLSALESGEFNLRDFERQRFNPVMRRKRYPVVRLQIGNNPLECDCWIYDLLRFHEKRMNPDIQILFDILIEGLTCAGPPELRDTPVMSLNSTSFLCRLPQNSPDNRTCPDACDCHFRVQDRAFFINCSDRGFIQTSIDFNPGPSLHTELNLAGNSLKKIPAIGRPGFDNVTVLCLSRNQITQVSLRDLPENLTELYLHGNNLTELDGEVIRFLAEAPKLQRLTLHGNPWRCDCDTLDFFYFIQSNQSKYSELQRVTCDSSDIPIIKMSSSDVCPPSLTMIVGTSVAVFLLFITIISTALYYRFQTEIKVWLFAHQLLPWFVNEAELDREKIYDAFVSYSHQDEDFVANTLVPKLEEGPRGFKLCLHYRDWLAGEFIGDQIERSVAESRRTIVVLSRNFLESEWGRVEFRTAHCNALSEGRVRVIVVIYGDIGPIDGLESELASYMRTNTYVEWGDRWFWEKLRYALPHYDRSF